MRGWVESQPQSLSLSLCGLVVDWRAAPAVLRLETQWAEGSGQWGGGLGSKEVRPRNPSCLGGKFKLQLTVAVWVPAYSCLQLAWDACATHSCVPGESYT